MHPRFPCKDCDKTFSRKNALKRHRSSFAHTSGIPCHLCQKAFSRRDLSVHLQKIHEYSLKEAGRKSGSLKKKTKRSNWKESEDDRMAAQIERALLNPTKSKTTESVVATIAVPKDVPFTLSKAPSMEVEDTQGSVDNHNVQGEELPITFNITKSNSLEALSKQGNNINAVCLGTILSVQDHVSEFPSITPATTNQEVLEQATQLALPIFDLHEWERLEKCFQESSIQAQLEAALDVPDQELGCQPTGDVHTNHNIMECTVSADIPISKVVEEVNTPPSSPTPPPPDSPEPLGEDSTEGLHTPEIPLSPNPVNEDKGPEPITSSPFVKESIGIPATWLQVEDLWLTCMLVMKLLP